MTGKTRKDSDDPKKASTGNAVDRASSVTPLDDDLHIDPSTVRKTVRMKQGESHAEPGNPQAGPGPVTAQPNRPEGKGHRATKPTPKAIEDEIQHSPKEQAKESSKAEDIGPAIKRAGR